MRSIWTIARKEIKSFFDSLTAYVLIILFLVFTGFFVWITAQNIFYMKIASLHVFFSNAYWSLFIFIPALTMRTLSEEKKIGTLELLLTKAITTWDIVVGKFIAIFLLVMITLSLSIPYYITVAFLGPIDHGAVWCGYLGITLTAAFYVSIGVWASSFTKNQIVAFLISLFVGIFFQFLFGIISVSLSGTLANIFNYLSLSEHYGNITRGIVDSKDIIYFLSIVFIALISAEFNLVKKRLL